MKRTVVITGGSDGLGKAIAKRLNAENNVIIISKDEESLVKTSKEINCEYYVCDVTDYKQVDNTINSILGKTAFVIYIGPFVLTSIQLLIFS